MLRQLCYVTTPLLASSRLLGPSASTPACILTGLALPLTLIHQHACISEVSLLALSYTKSAPAYLEPLDTCLLHVLKPKLVNQVHSTNLTNHWLLVALVMLPPPAPLLTFYFVVFSKPSPFCFAFWVRRMIPASSLLEFQNNLYICGCVWNIVGICITSWAIMNIY